LQEVQGISLVFGEMWDSTALTPELSYPPFATRALIPGWGVSSSQSRRQFINAKDLHRKSEMNAPKKMG
jgi:hypothetical protein